MRLRLLWLLALGATLLSGLVFLPVLGSYPLPFADESFFAWPAVNYLMSGSFTYDQGPRVPYGQQVWAFHAPLYPLAQVPVFACFGVSTFTMRLLSFVAAAAGHLLLTWVLLRRGYPWVAAACAVAWLGDRSLLYTLHGRMEGLVLFLGLAGFCALFVALDNPDGIRHRPLALAGFAFGLAVVTHVITGFWTLALLPAVWTACPPATRRPALASLLCGWLIGIVPGVLFFAPHPREAFAQFQWHLTTNFGQGMSVTEKVLYVLRTLTWARAWVVALVLVGVGLAVVWIRAGTDKSLAGLSPEVRLARLATLFTAFSLPIFLHRGLYDYYVVYFTSWATLALVATVTVWFRHDARPIRAAALASLVIVAWVPSAAWNALRVREAYALRAAMDPAPFQRELRRQLLAAPSPVVLQGTPWLFPWVVPAGIAFRPLSYLDPAVPPEPGRWLLVTTAHWNEMRKAGGVDPRQYRLWWKTDVYQGQYSFPYEVQLLAPRGTDGDRPPSPYPQ